MERSATRRPTTPAPTASSPRPGWRPAWWRPATTSRVPAPRSADPDDEAGLRVGRDSYLRRRAAELSGLAAALTGSRRAAADAVVEAARRLRRRGSEPHFDQAAVRELARAAGPVPEVAAGLTRRQWAALVIAVDLGWDP